METLQLKTEFDGRGEVRGYHFRQIKGTNKAFMYEVTRNDTKHYEVFKRRVNKQYNVISYPRSKSFGIWAWTCSDIKKATDRFESLNQ